MIGTAASRSPNGRFEDEIAFTSVAVAEVEGSGHVELPLRLAQQLGDSERLECGPSEASVIDETLGVRPATKARQARLVLTMLTARRTLALATALRPVRARAVTWALVALASVALSGCAIPVVGGRDCGPGAFDRDAWLALTHPTSHDKPTIRHKMSDVLIDCDVLTGHARPQLTKLLGPPDDQWPSGWSWVLGPAGYGDLSSGYDALTVLFGPDGHVSKVSSSD